MSRKEQRRKEWIARVADFQASGQSMQSWSNQNHVSKDQLRYWLRTLPDHTVPAKSYPARSCYRITRGDTPTRSCRLSSN